MLCPLEIGSGVTVSTSGQCLQSAASDHRSAAAIRIDVTSTTMVITSSSRTMRRIDLHVCGQASDQLRWVGHLARGPVVQQGGEKVAAAFPFL